MTARHRRVADVTGGRRGVMTVRHRPPFARDDAPVRGERDQRKRENDDGGRCAAPTDHVSQV